jgi:serine/threonine-protein kinase RsbW/sigma-B regulation protein RsbU (phosphoserine phosphatase)
MPRERRAAVSNDALSFAVVNELAEVPRAAAQVEAFCRDHAIPGPVVDKFNLALEEALTNAISYAFADGRRHRIEVQIEVHVESRGSYLTAMLSDDGAPFDPLSQPPPDIHAPITERRVGGLGIHLLRKLMDGAEYHRRDGRNHLTFRIRVAGSSK